MSQTVDQNTHSADLMTQMSRLQKAGTSGMASQMHEGMGTQIY